MTLINRAALVLQDPKREEKHVEALGGSVTVVEMDLTTRLTVERVSSGVDKADPGAVYAVVPHVLAACVLDADGEPLLNRMQWQSFGSRNRDAAVDLFNTAMRLSDIGGEDAAKN